MIIPRILLVVLLFVPSISFAAPNVSLPYHQGFESETVDVTYNDGACGGLSNQGTTSDCDTVVRDDYPARYGSNYISLRCDYTGDPSDRNLATRANALFTGYKDQEDCHVMDTNDGTEYWVGWSNYIPVDYPVEIWHQGSFQFFADNTNEWFLFLSYGGEVYDGEWVIGGHSQTALNGWGSYLGDWEADRGEWVDWVVRVVWYDIANANAKLEVYKDGVLVRERNEVSNMLTGSEPYMVFMDYNPHFYSYNLPIDAHIKDPNSATWRETTLDEVRFTEGTASEYSYCDVAPPIYGASSEITYPENNEGVIPTSFTALFGGYVDHRDDLQSCFSYEETTVQIDEYGGDWSSLVFNSTSSASETQMAVSGLTAGTEYQIRVRHNSQRVDSTDEYDGEWTVHRFNTSSSTDTTPPTWDSGDGVDHLVTYDDSVGFVGVWFYPCTDAVDGSDVTYRSYYAPTASWDGTTWSNNSSVSGGHVYSLTEGVNYTFGARCSDLSGNEDTNTTTLTTTIGGDPDDPLEVTDVSGSFIDGNTVVISGENFGASGPTVVLFDDFEGGTLGENIETGTGSAKVGDWNARSGSSYYGGASLSGDKSFSSTYANGYANYIEALLLANTRNVYLSWWLFLPAGNNYPGEGSVDGINWKQMWIQGSSTTDDDMVVPSRISSWYINGNESDPGYKNYTTVDFNKGEWKRLSVWLKGSTSSSSNDGEVKFWELTDTGTVTRESDVGVNTLKATGTWDRVRPNGYGRQTDTCIVSFDDIYIASGANAQARVEIGNASTYLGSTELTILTPTDWDDTEISATVNAGTFEQYDNGYLYITDADGNTSDGFPVTFESTQTATTISGSGTNATTGSGTPAVVGVIGGAILLTIDGDAMTIDNDIITVEGLVQ